MSGLCRSTASLRRHGAGAAVGDRNRCAGDAAQDQPDSIAAAVPAAGCAADAATQSRRRRRRQTPARRQRRRPQPRRPTRSLRSRCRNAKPSTPKPTPAETAAPRRCRAADPDAADRSICATPPPARSPHVPAARRARGVEAFYQSRNYAPLWIDGTARPTRAQGGDRAPRRRSTPMASIRPIIRCRHSKRDRAPTRWPRPSCKLTASVLDLRAPRADRPRRVSRASAATSITAARAGAGRRPGQARGRERRRRSARRVTTRRTPATRRSRRKLAELRGNDQRRRGPAPHSGRPDAASSARRMKDPRVPLLRERLGVAGKADDTTYDKQLAEAVKRVPEGARASTPTAISTTRRVDALNGPPTAPSRSRHHRRQHGALALDAARPRQAPT